MNDEFIVAETHRRIEGMLREAAAYRLLIEAAPLHFRPHTFTRFRAGLSRALIRAAAIVAPYGDTARGASR